MEFKRAIRKRVILEFMISLTITGSGAFLLPSWALKHPVFSRHKQFCSQR